ncbi:MAG: LytR C-terminal domain-containing protein [candidate division Zixibacteria bacterium]
MEALIAVVFFLLLAYVASFTLRVTRGVSHTIEPAANVVRVQVLNGCGIPRLAAKIADRLEKYSDADVEIVVVDSDNFETMTLDSTFIIARDENKKSARLLARKLGLDDGSIVFRKLEDNYRSISVTLVLGSDYERLRMNQ